MKKTVCLDFDGVVHSYTSKFTIPEFIADPPVSGVFEFIEECLDHELDVAVYSTRSKSQAGREAIKKWFRDYGCNSVEWIKFPESKPMAILYIDDRGYHFDGKFPSMLFIKSFKPWNKV